MMKHLTQPTQAQQRAANYGHLGKVDGAPENGAAHSHRTHFPNRVRFLDGADNDSRRGGISPSSCPAVTPHFILKFALDGADNDSRRGGISPQFVPRRHASFYTQVRPSMVPTMTQGVAAFLPQFVPRRHASFYTQVRPSTVPT